MSVINKMLQELDRRNATAGSDGEQRPHQVKPVYRGKSGHEWFWRIVAVLMLAAVAWVGWVAYQLQPGPSIATDQAFKAAEQARTASGRVPTPVKAPEQQSPEVAAAPEPKPAAVPEKPAAERPAAEKPASAVPETLRLAKSIETPIPAPRPEVSPPAPAKAQVPRPAPQPSGKSAVDKRDREKGTNELADAQFRRAGMLLNQGRVSEAEEQLVGALQSDPSHGPARQAYVALLLEQRRTDAARRVLGEALALNPSHPTFALALARIHAEQRDYAGALEIMDRAGSVGKNADFLALRGAVLQRMQRHKDAVEAYEASIRGAPQPGTTWVGYGISLEALGRKSEAAQAYRRSLGAGGLAGEVKEYAEARVRALE